MALSSPKAVAAPTSWLRQRDIASKAHASHELLKRVKEKKRLLVADWFLF